MTESAREFKCIHCEMIFDTRGKKIHHVDRMHRQSLKIKLQDDSMKSFFKDHEGRWNCCKQAETRDHQAMVLGQRTIRDYTRS